MWQVRRTRRTLADLFLLGALLGLAACGSTAHAAQAVTQPVKVYTPSGQVSTTRCDGKQAKEAYLFPTLTYILRRTGPYL
jgi:ABC-type glycerol-3-phosphate transport system substrate-binding protein